MQKMNRYENVPTQSEAIERLRNGIIRLPPVTLRVLNTPAQNKVMGGYNAIVEVSWRGKECRFALEYKSRSTPKVFEETVARIKSCPSPLDTYPMLMMPFLSPGQLAELERREVSGIDLCGNGVIIIPGELCLFRSGQPNQYPQSAPIKNIYKGRSSLVPRVFLARPRYQELNDVKREIEARNGRIAISTISKAVATLDEELIISREAGSIRLLQADALLDKLADNYVEPRITGRWSGRWEGKPGEFLPELFGRVGKRGIRAVVSGG